MTTQIICQLNPDVPPTGSDLGIVNAARKSFGRRSEWDYTCECGIKKEPEAGYNKWVGCGADQIDCHNTRKNKSLKDKDKRLLEFLIRGMTADDFDKLLYEFSETDLSKHPELLWEWRNTPSHDTPVNHSFFSFEVKAPIFVARHLVKHEYLIMSEYSRRYITDDVEFYTPEVWRKAAKDVKQGSSNEGVDTKEVWGHHVDLTGLYKQDMFNQWQRYKEFVGDGTDRVAPELARIMLPQSLMTSWTWSGTLGAFGNMCKLRLSKDTQYETRLVAEQVYTELKKQFPVAAPMIVEGVF
jgi:thymidylate synthase (FAD)